MKTIRHSSIRYSYFRIHSNVYSLGRTLLFDRRATLQNQVAISDFQIFSVNLEFVVCILSFLENKMFRNFLSDIVTLEYTLMRCIHWAVRFSLDRRASLQNQVTISDFLISSVNMEFVVCLLSFLENRMLCLETFYQIQLRQNTLL